MTLENPNLSDMQRAVRGAFAAHWRLLMFQGVIMIILGILAVAAPVIASIAIDIYVGWLFLFSGVIGLIALFSSPSDPRLPVEPDHGGSVDCSRDPVDLEADRRRVVAYVYLDRVLSRRGRFSDRHLAGLSRFAAGHMGLDAGERRLGSAAGRDHRSRLAGERHLGSGSPRRLQLADVGLGDRDDGLRRSRSDQDGAGLDAGATTLGATRCRKVCGIQRAEHLTPRAGRGAVRDLGHFAPRLAPNGVARSPGGAIGPAGRSGFLTINRKTTAAALLDGAGWRANGALRCAFLRGR